ncbi:MAG: sulfotransferase, partial [Candidatus Omnitrophica bacterium]|nr:sulfotransferase [Candidatus Omnitrophota bacterium]
MTGYSALERVLHRLAFKTYAAQIPLADIEDRIYSKRLVSLKIDRPVFITALPRAGTTLLLECCASLKGFASHSYRDMPFVLIPCLWGRFSAPFRRSGISRERAHGDGMQINFDSPEALEEVIWSVFWRRHYLTDRIVPWQDEYNSEFEEFFRNHMRKIIFLRRGKGTLMARYLSKNNLNIARISILHRLFPDSVIIVPFRQPLQHAASLLKQHNNFLRIHEDDPFASEYMRAIGHYDFGENLRPIDFAGWFDKRESRSPCSLGFWLEYWVASYKHLLTEPSGFFHFLNYDKFCDNPRLGLQTLADMIDSGDPDSLLARAEGIRRMKSHE